MYRKRLRYLRVANGMTQQEVADILQIHRTTYAFYETGRSKPDVDMLATLARTFRVSLDFIINGKENEKVQLGDNPSRYEASEYPEYLSQLTPDEKNLIITFRAIKSKEKAIADLKALYLEELAAAEEEEDFDDFGDFGEESE